VSLATPRLDDLLRRFKNRLVRLIWWHGMGTILAATAAWFLLAYLGDRWMHLPAGVRIVNTAILVTLPLWLFCRELWARLQRVPNRAGLAILLEREHSGTEDLLVSAVQLAPKAEGSASRPLIEGLVARAEALSQALEPGDALDARLPRRRGFAGLGAVLVCGLVLAQNPSLTGIFLQRMTGADIPWPQRTHLHLDIPLSEAGGTVQTTEDGVNVRVARGTDLTVLVRIEGVIPDRIDLNFDGGGVTQIATGGTSPVRTQLRNLQDSATFRITGGDDQDGEPRVAIEVLQPPDVGGLAFSVEPPAYSELESQLVLDTTIEVLEGSIVTVHVRPDPEEATGQLRLLSEDRVIQLEPDPFPTNDSSPVGLSCTFIALTETVFQLELTDSTGLSNPDPGVYSIRVRPDQRPDLSLISPGRSEVPVVAGGAIPLRVRVEDDLGLAQLAWDVRDVDDPERMLSGSPLMWAPLADAEMGFVGRRDAGLAHVRLEVNDLDSSGPPTPGWTGVLQVVADDTREPDAGQAHSTPVRLRLVEGDEFLRRLKDGLARAGEDAGGLSSANEAARVATREVLLQFASDDPEGAEREIASLIHEAKRVEGDARALGRDLADLTEGLIYSRLDPRGGALLEATDAVMAKISDRSFHPEPWRTLSRDYAGGRLGQAELAGELIALVGMALDVSEVHAATAAEALAEARAASDLATARIAMERAETAQASAQAQLDALLSRLGEWDNFQSVLTLTRDILNRQKNLIQRTRQLAEDE
jgi:hypothetical protein